MSKKFVKGNTYVFTSKKLQQHIKINKRIKRWDKEANGRKVTIINENYGRIYLNDPDWDEFYYEVEPDWCKCIKVGDR